MCVSASSPTEPGNVGRGGEPTDRSSVNAIFQACTSFMDESSTVVISVLANRDRTGEKRSATV